MNRALRFIMLSVLALAIYAVCLVLAGCANPKPRHHAKQAASPPLPDNVMPALIVHHGTNPPPPYSGCTHWEYSTLPTNFSLQYYTLQWATNDGTRRPLRWIDVATNFPTDCAVTNTPMHVGTGNGFYRVKLVPF